MQPQIVRAAWIGMELSGWFVIVPLACLAFLTGLVLSLGTPWGLFKHYWVVIALVPDDAVTGRPAAPHAERQHLGRPRTDSRRRRSQPPRRCDVLHPALGLLLLIVITVLNVHKPRGLTPYGQHKQTKEPKGSAKRRTAATR